MKKITESQKKRIITLLGIFLLLFLSLRTIDSLMQGDEKAVEDEIEMIPDPEENKVETSKIEAYSNVEKMWDDYAGAEDTGDLYAEVEDSRKKDRTVSEKQVYEGIREGKRTGGSSSTRFSVRARAGSEPVPGDEGYREYRMRKYYESTDAAVEKGEAEKDSIRAAEAAPADRVPSEIITIGEDATVRRSSAMSTLDGGWSDSGAGGFSSLSDDEETVSEFGYPIECMFVRAEKLHDGSRVSVRLLEDMVIDGVLIPKNTHLMATCTIRDRLELTVSSLERNSKIYALNYEAYDNDGSKGIYCPNLNAQSVQTAKRDGYSTVRSLLGGRLGGIASTALNTGISIAQNKSGEVTVNVPAGYRFFLVKSERKS